MGISGIVLEYNCDPYKIRYPRTSCEGEGELIGTRAWRNLKCFVPVLMGWHRFRTNHYPAASIDVRNVGGIFSDLCSRSIEQKMSE